MSQLHSYSVFIAVLAKFQLHLLRLHYNHFYSNYYPLNREEILRKLSKTISQESVNVSMEKALINRGRGKNIPSGTVVNEEIPQEEAKSIAAMEQFG